MCVNAPMHVIQAVYSNLYVLSSNKFYCYFSIYTMHHPVIRDALYSATRRSPPLQGCGRRGRGDTLGNTSGWFGRCNGQSKGNGLSSVALVRFNNLHMYTHGRAPGCMRRSPCSDTLPSAYTPSTLRTASGRSRGPWRGACPAAWC